MGTKTLLSECFLNRGFTLLQSVVIESGASDPTFYIEYQKGMQYSTKKSISSWLYAFTFFSNLQLLFCPVIMSHQLYTTASLYSHSYLFSGQKHMRQSYDLVWQMNHRVKTKALYSLVDISMPRCVSLAQPWHPSLPQTVFWQSACSWLLKHRSAFSVLLVHGLMGEAILYIRLAMLKGFPQWTQLELLRWCAVLTKTFDQSGPWLPRSHV